MMIRTMMRKKARDPTDLASRGRVRPQASSGRSGRVRLLVNGLIGFACGALEFRRRGQSSVEGGSAQERKANHSSPPRRAVAAYRIARRVLACRPSSAASARRKGLPPAG